MQEKLARGGASLKWVEQENLHITLLFLGEVDERDLVDLCRAVARCCDQHERFLVTVEGVGCFPNPRRPRIVWAGVSEGADQLRALHDSLEPPLMELGCYRREERLFTPHITLGRVKTDESGDALTTALARCAGWHGGTVEVTEVQVLSSSLMSQGPEYTVLSRAKLCAVQE